MPSIELNCAERVALRELELSVLPPQPLWSVLSAMEFNARDGTYCVDMKPTQIGQLRAYIRANANGEGRLHALHAKLECIYQQVEPSYKQSKARCY